MNKQELKELIRETVKEVIDEENPIYKDLADVPDYWKRQAEWVAAIYSITTRDRSVLNVNTKVNTVMATKISARACKNSRVQRKERSVYHG